MATTTNLLALESISKSFDGVRGLDHVNLTVGSNEIVGLLADQQSLWRNIFMGRERTRRLGLLDLPAMYAETRKLMHEFLRFTSQAITPESFVGSMAGGERQGVAIARALYFEAELVILDEPTMGLSVTETRKTLDFVRAVKAAGKAG